MRETGVSIVQIISEIISVMMNFSLFFIEWFIDEWTMEEKVVFERAFHMHGKHFHRIKAFVSDQVVATIVFIHNIYTHLG